MTAEEARDLLTAEGISTAELYCDPAAVWVVVAWWDHPRHVMCGCADELDDVLVGLARSTQQ